jgi:hypothetical protein
VSVTLADLPGLLLWALPVLPLLAALTAAMIPHNDRLTLRAVGVGAMVGALVAGVAAVALGWASFATGGVPAPTLWSILAAVPPLRLEPVVVLPLLTALVALPLALRTGAPRITEGMTAYVVICLAQGAAVSGALLIADVGDALAASLVAAVPGFALLARGVAVARRRWARSRRPRWPRHVHPARYPVVCADAHCAGARLGSPRRRTLGAVGLASLRDGAGRRGDVGVRGVVPIGGRPALPRRPRRGAG